MKLVGLFSIIEFLSICFCSKDTGRTNGGSYLGGICNLPLELIQYLSFEFLGGIEYSRLRLVNRKLFYALPDLGNGFERYIEELSYDESFSGNGKRRFHQRKMAFTLSRFLRDHLESSKPKSMIVQDAFHSMFWYCECSTRKLVHLFCLLPNEKIDDENENVNVNENENENVNVNENENESERVSIGKVSSLDITIFLVRTTLIRSVCQFDFSELSDEEFYRSVVELFGTRLRDRFSAPSNGSRERFLLPSLTLDGNRKKENEEDDLLLCKSELGAIKIVIRSILLHGSLRPRETSAMINFIRNYTCLRNDRNAFETIALICFMELLNPVASSIRSMEKIMRHFIIFMRPLSYGGRRSAVRILLSSKAAVENYARSRNINRFIENLLNGDDLSLLHILCEVSASPALVKLREPLKRHLMQRRWPLIGFKKGFEQALISSEEHNVADPFFMWLCEENQHLAAKTYLWLKATVIFICVRFFISPERAIHLLPILRETWRYSEIDCLSSRPQEDHNNENENENHQKNGILPRSSEKRAIIIEIFRNLLNLSVAILLITESVMAKILLLNEYFKPIFDTFTLYLLHIIVFLATFTGNALKLNPLDRRDIADQINKSFEELTLTTSTTF